MAIDGLSERVPPSDRVPEQLLHAAPILKRRRRQYRGEIGKKGFVLGVSSARGKYRRRGHQGDPPLSQEAPCRGLGWGRARDPSGLLVVAPLPSLEFREASGALIFYLIFLEFLEHF